MATRESITAERVRELFDYDQHSGRLIWRVQGGAGAHRHVPGDMAGSDDSKGYFQVNFDGHVWRLHRIIWMWMTGIMPPRCIEVDHKDLDGHNNRWANLRLATHSQNMGNQKKRATNTSGHKGVYFNKKDGTWFATLHVKCDDKEHAREIYRKMASVVYGEFARFA